MTPVVQPTVCPTCLSDDPKVCREGFRPNKPSIRPPHVWEDDEACCPDVFHVPASSTPTEVERLRALLADTVRAHEAITARFRAGTPKPPPEWAFDAMAAAPAALSGQQDTTEAQS